MSNFATRNRGAARLSADQVIDIRTRYQGGMTQGALARMYKVSIGQIGRIVRGESWHMAEEAAGIPSSEQLANMHAAMAEAQRKSGDGILAGLEESAPKNESELPEPSEETLARKRALLGEGGEGR